MSLTLKQITDALRVSRARVEQWISRGHFRPPQEPVLGVARDWEFVDALRLALMTEMLDAGMTAQQAGVLVYLDPHSFKDDEAFFVAWQGYHASTLVSEEASDGRRKMYLPGTWYSDIVRRRDLTDFVGNPDVTISLVINLDSLEGRVSAALENRG